MKFRCLSLSFLIALPLASGDTKPDPRAHWAFKAPVLPAVPAFAASPWIKSPVDAFVLGKLQASGLTPSPEAAPETLLRRLSLDLIGLPPTLEELDTFLSEPLETAYPKAVERLLGSPHYGERWGRHWLDAARYADSDGYEKDKPRFVWFFRDWVINALNADMPYDQFVIEQIAGDLLPNATQDQKVATGFLRNSMINEEGGIDPEQFRMEAMFDRMDAIGKSVLGLTIQCAQCHDHKFDPISQREYYELFAFLNNAHEGTLTTYTAAEQQLRADLFRQIAENEAMLKASHADWETRFAEWQSAMRALVLPKWQVITPEVELESTGGQSYRPMEDGSILALGYAPTKHTVRLDLAKLPVEKATAVRLELMLDPNLPRLGPGRSIYGTAALSEFTIEIADQKIKWQKALADVNPTKADLPTIYDDKSDAKRITGPIDYAIDGDYLTAWCTDLGAGRRNEPATAVFYPEAPIRGENLVLLLNQGHGGWNSDDNQNYNLGRFRLSVTDSEAPQADPLPARIRTLLDLDEAERSPRQKAALFSYWRSTVDDWRDTNEAIEALWKQHPEGETQLTLIERTMPRETSVLFRGDFLKPTDKALPGVPAVLHPLDNDAPRDRLGLAKWLVDRRSPTAARALVNRVWQSYFGTGLVSSAEDLGVRCEAPSHPELLDWLAVRFMDEGWKLKDLHRWIVSSSTYRQASKVTPEAYERDPYNRDLARASRFRVEGEIVRDIALASSGLLNPAVGGASVFPPAPAFLFQPPVSYGPKVWEESKGAERYRRALYTFRFRSVPYPVLQTFDTPNGDFSCVRRSRSNTPLQALMTLNETQFVECAQAFGARLLNLEGDDGVRLETGFRLCLSRKPTTEEKGRLLEYLKSQRNHYTSRPVEAKAFAGEASWPANAAAAERAAWAAIGRVLVNLDETITKE